MSGCDFDRPLHPLWCPDSTEFGTEPYFPSKHRISVSQGKEGAVPGISESNQGTAASGDNEAQPGRSDPPGVDIRRSFL